MAKKKKKSQKSMAQQVMGVATMGLPAPVQQVASSKMGSRLLLLIVPVLVATGILSISWSGGMPSFSINKQRAAEVGEQVRSEAIKAAERLRDSDDEGSYR